MNTFLSAFLLSAALLACSVRAGDTPWKTYGEGEEQHRRSQPYIISYPADFEVDPRSDWGEVPRPRDPQVKSIEHVMILHNPEHTLTVQACDYDMIWLKAEPEGIRNMLNAFDTIRIVDIREKYILVFAEKPERHLAYAAYFTPPSSTGCVYWQSLAFRFEKGTSYADHKEVVDEMVRRFVPAYARHREPYPLFFTTDAAFCRSLRDSQAVYTARTSSERTEPRRMGEIPLAERAEIPADDDVSRTDNTTKELLALLAYESGNFPCLEYLLRRGLTLPDREGERLKGELAGQQRPVVLALFLLYEPLTEQERERALEDIRQDAVLQREVERIYTQYLRLNQEAGGHAPVIVTPEERSRRTEPTFFNTPDFSLF